MSSKAETLLRVKQLRAEADALEQSIQTITPLAAIGKHFDESPATPLLSTDLAAQLEQQEQLMLNELKSYASRDMIKLTPRTEVLPALSTEGEQILAAGFTPDLDILRQVVQEGSYDLPKPNPVAGQLLKKKVVELQAGKLMLPGREAAEPVRELLKAQLAGDAAAAAAGAAALDADLAKTFALLSAELATQQEYFQHLTAISKGDHSAVSKDMIAVFTRRKWAANKKVTVHLIEKGPQFALEVQVQAKPVLTKKDLDNYIAGQMAPSRSLNIDYVRGRVPQTGHLHPLLKVREEYRKIFLNMGFTEMKTNNFVESSFWNFDTLFQPQHHPARDAHDTFFVRSPAKAALPTSAEGPCYVEAVKKVHSEGDFGSIGHRTPWKEDEAQKNILRTHTTAASARALKELADQGEFRPVKYFSIDRVFRNETLDHTHLAEFHQIEGLIADRNLSLAHLLSTLKEFFRALGMKDLRFKPAYNPYTEPSMEVFAFHPGLKKWIEVGNSGVFRPEMLRPMGLPEDVSVIAWGLSLERPTMILYGIDNIRDLCGHTIDLKLVKTNPFCRLKPSDEEAEETSTAAAAAAAASQ
ncbi:phenylalanyl-tRNA synthetase alpha chain [Fonticula alba]|uniref:phenylalanine--tRNA ligase n=1 Tax=Fonticula alba TaxID=691883 RepID=A0A058Z2M9_FONAL|nr:phenylalanyl-tRNA synthetase alpha chain [Fonticula alba]KCV68490.1 phenylalanyl-tRNA synthetase alpha chain [Fonticula alba]|eukprot:XP_009496922.1 phenylalanyl-tRNA synthetase alpha chain [Fonticula alba]